MWINTELSYNLASIVPGSRHIHGKAEFIFDCVHHTSENQKLDRGPEAKPQCECREERETRRNTIRPQGGYTRHRTGIFGDSVTAVLVNNVNTSRPTCPSGIFRSTHTHCHHSMLKPIRLPFVTHDTLPCDILKQSTLVLCLDTARSMVFLSHDI